MIYVPRGDDVQRSIELLDKVLSEYDEHESIESGGGIEGGGGGVGGSSVVVISSGGGVGVTAATCTSTAQTTTSAADSNSNSSSTEPSIGLTPDDESPSLGHQSEDDGYMSMNGRKAKMALVALRPVPDCPESQDQNGTPAQEFPPPPEEAERIISTLLPMVSPGNSTKRSDQKQQQRQQQQRQNGGSGSQKQWIAHGLDDPKRSGQAVTTQTTLPKTRHQRPYGWENGVGYTGPNGPNNGGNAEPFHLAEPPSPPSKFASLPLDGKLSFNWAQARQQQQQQQQQQNNSSLSTPQEHQNNTTDSSSSNKRRRDSSEDGLEDLRQSSEDGLDEEDEENNDDDEEAEDEREDDDDDDDDDDDVEDEDESNRPSPEKERASSVHNNHHLHHHHHHHHHISRRPPRQNEIIKSNSVEDHLLMNNHLESRVSDAGSNNGCTNNGSSSRSEHHYQQRYHHHQPQHQSQQQSHHHNHNHQQQQQQHHHHHHASSTHRSASSTASAHHSARSRCRNNSDSSDGGVSGHGVGGGGSIGVVGRSCYSRANSESESRSSMPRSTSASVERFSMRANCDSSDFSRANSMSNERFHSDFSLARASVASSNDRVSVPTSEPFSMRNLDFVPFSLGRSESSERCFSGLAASDRYSEGRCSEVFSTRCSEFSTRNSTDFRTQSEEEHFSDDSLEELLPPPPAVSKRHSIAWELTLDDEPVYIPGSTKVVGRRRRKSSDVSSVGSASKLRDFDDWQDPRVSTTDDDLISPYSDSSCNDLDQIRPQDLSKHGTYVIRKGRKRERKQLPPPSSNKSPSKSIDDDDYDDERQNGTHGIAEVRRYSNTFDNLKSLLKESSNHFDVTCSPPSEFANQTSSQPDLLHMVLDDPADDKRRSVIHVEPSAPMEEAAAAVVAAIEAKVEKKTLEEVASDRGGAADQVKITSFAERPSECNGITIMNLEPPKAVDDLPQTTNAQHSLYEPKQLDEKSAKEAISENRRQIDLMNEALKELDSAESEAVAAVAAAAATNSGSRRHWRSNGSKRNSFDGEGVSANGIGSCERRRADYDSSRRRQLQQPPPPPPHAIDVTDAVSAGGAGKSASIERASVERRRLNGRTRELDLHKNDTKQIENVIDAILEDSKKPDFQVSVEVLEFPPLPPSPVEEADEESSDVGGSGGCNGTSSSATRDTTPKVPKVPPHANRTMEYRPRVPPHRGISLDSSKEHHTTSLNTRSMDAGYARGRRTAASIANARREQVPVERRTLPTDLPGPSSRRHRPFTKRLSPSTEACTPGGSGSVVQSGSVVGTTSSANGGVGVMQTSCSLPETPVFARGSDIPRTPQHANNIGAPTTQPRRAAPGWYAPTTGTGTGYRRNNPGLEQAIIGTELLRLAGGPGRGWYPTRKSNQPRPASIEHLERLNATYDSRMSAGTEPRKPLTLPTNITPNKYFGQSKHNTSTSTTREALRRVTSLLIKKGGGSKEGKNGKDSLSPSGPYASEYKF
uniref:Uncharacterized protein n=1 Tax=Trichogramma kaykai TaxID=54128 RepID=A0ABD2W1M0_9HYME